MTPFVIERTVDLTLTWEVESAMRTGDEQDAAMRTEVVTQAEMCPGSRR